MGASTSATAVAFLEAHDCAHHETVGAAAGAALAATVSALADVAHDVAHWPFDCEHSCAGVNPSVSALATSERKRVFMVGVAGARRRPPEGDYERRGQVGPERSPGFPTPSHIGAYGPPTGTASTAPVSLLVAPPALGQDERRAVARRPLLPVLAAMRTRLTPSHRAARLSLGGGLLALTFGAGRLVGAGEAPASRVPEASEAARLVSEAIQAVAASAEASVLQVRALAKSRRGGAPRRLQDGSGVALSADGVVVTNEHVVRGADALEVILSDGSVHPARVLGRDPRTDLAVLRVEGVALRPMPLADEPPQVGELVLAMGNPLGFGHTVTLGVVNGLGRSNLDIVQFEDYIQTDAAVNPGNSGGPLVDLAGRAVGINVAMGLESNGDKGLAFAIPARMVRRVVDQIVLDGAVRHARFGARPHWAGQFRRAAADDLAAGYTGRSQVKLREVEEGSPAAGAGLAVGDIVVSIGSRRLSDDQSLRNAILEARPGDAAEVVVWRAGKEHVLQLVFGEEPR